MRIEILLDKCTKDDTCAALGIFDDGTGITRAVAGDKKTSHPGNYSQTGADGIKCYRDNLDEYGNECLF